MMDRRFDMGRFLGVFACAAGWAGIAYAGGSEMIPLRDPTAVPGATVRAPLKQFADEVSSGTLSAIFVDGRPYVMVGSRLRGVGDRLGKQTIERITESEVWLRNGKNLKKIALHRGVHRVPDVPAKD